MAQTHRSIWAGRSAGSTLQGLENGVLPSSAAAAPGTKPPTHSTPLSLTSKVKKSSPQAPELGFCST